MTAYVTCDRWTQLRVIADALDGLAAEVIRDAANALEEADATIKRLHTFVAEIAEDPHVYGSDARDIHIAARRLLGLEPDPYA